MRCRAVVAAVGLNARHNEAMSLRTLNNELTEGRFARKRPMTTGRLVKSHEDITMTEVTFSGVNGVLGRSYSVRAANDPTSTRQFRDVAADTYYEELMRRLDPDKPGLIET
jgi:hypothetical protein